MDTIICCTRRLPEGEQQNITFTELLLDDQWADGQIHCPEHLYAEIGCINPKLTAKQNYDFLLRAIQKYPVMAVGTASADVSPATAAGSPLADNSPEMQGDWDSFRTDCYIAGKYQQELFSSGLFNTVMEALLADASRLPDPDSAVAWLEKMIFREKEYYEIDDAVRPILIYRGADTCYNTLNQFADELAAALRRCRQAVEVFDLEKEGNPALTKYIGSRFKAIIGIQTYAFSILMQDNKTNLHDLIHGPKYNLILDHPAWLKEHIENGPENYYLLTHDRNYCAFAKRYYKNIKDCIYFPPAGILPEKPAKEEKQFDITFVGSYHNYRDRLAIIYAYGRPYRFLAARFLLRMRQHPNESAEQSLRSVLELYNITLEDDDFLDLFYELRQACFCIMLYYREKIIKTLLEAGIEIHVYSDSWQKSPFAGHPCLHCHPAVNIKESLHAIQLSRISLNIMSWHKDGLTERVLNSMLCKSAVLSDRSSILEEIFTDNEDIVLFDLEQIHLLPKRVKDLLADERQLERIADNGYRKTIGEWHLWSYRAIQFLSVLEKNTSECR